MSIMDESSKAAVKEQPVDNDDDRLRAPVFLYRNRRKMKQIRKHLLQNPTETTEGKLEFEHGLIVRQVPFVRKLFYDQNTTDYMSYKRHKPDQSTL